MYPNVKSVRPIENYHLELVYDNDEIRVFDLNPYLNIGRFKELRDTEIFNNVRVSFDSIAWQNGIDIDPETLFSKSKKVN